MTRTRFLLEGSRTHRFVLMARNFLSFTGAAVFSSLRSVADADEPYAHGCRLIGSERATPVPDDQGTSETASGDTSVRLAIVH